jgi:predicted O-methyltransferase YrrM
MGSLSSIPIRPVFAPARCTITAVSHHPPTTHPHEFAEGFVMVDPAIRDAMAWADEVGVRAVRPGAGAALRLLAAAGRARTVVELGTGTGCSGLWLLRGMRPDGVLTTIDIEPEHQHLARAAFGAAGFAPGRTRIITGRALDVLPRLADGGYDLVFVDGPLTEYEAYVNAAHRLLRPGGVLVLNALLAEGARLLEPTAHDPGSAALRRAVRSVREDERWQPALLDAGDGLLCAARLS